MDLIDTLLGFLGDIGSGIVAALNYLFNLIAAIAQFIWNALVLVAQFLLGALKAIGNFFVHLWQNFFRGIFTRIWDGLVTVTHWLEAHLRPIVRFLQRVQRYIDRIYRLYVRPFLVMIQHIRQFLLILRLLHLKFAEKLDSILGQIQRDVQGVFTQIRGVL